MTPSDLYNFYASTMPTPLGGWIQRKRIETEWRVICRYLPPGAYRLLEIGPGYGEFARFLASQQSWHYLALESNYRISRLVAKENFDVCQSSVPPFPLCSLSVDVIYASHVIEHLPGAEGAIEFLREAYRVLSPGGVLFLAAPDFMTFGKTFWDADYTHAFPVTRRRLVQLFSDSCFESMVFMYLAGFVPGVMGRVISCLARLIPDNLFDFAPMIGERFRRSRLTFMRNICAVARKPFQL
jgi:SAM-dependent methyltransferase